MRMPFPRLRVPGLIVVVLLALASLTGAQPGAQRPGEPTPGAPQPGQGQGQGQGQRQRFRFPVDQGQGPRGAARPPRDVAEETPVGTARIRGVVVAADSGSPVRRAVVRVSARELRESRTAMTDAQGRYEIKELPAGRYNVAVSKAGFVSLQYGQRRAFEQGRPLEVADGQSLDTINFTLPRGSVITGRLVDEFGEPVADAMVSASRYQYFRGQKRLLPSSRPTQTNDLGQYRLYGLTPGEYIVTASVRSMNFFENTEETSGYAPTYYPGTSNPGEAERVRVALGAETTADFGLIPARLVRITGTVLTSSGKPATGGMLRVVERGSAGGPMFGGFSGGRVRSDGTFSLSGIAPGAYTLIGSTTEMFGGRDDEPDAEFARVPLTVGNEDLTNVIVSTGKGATAVGQVVFEDGQTTMTPSAVRIFATSADPEETFGMGGRNGRVKDDWTFELNNLTGRVVLFLNTPPGGARQPFFIKAITLGGEDVTDKGFEARGGQRLEGLQIVITTKTTELSGTVKDGRGRPVADYAVVVFAEDDTLWASPSQRYTRVARPDQQGRFTVTGLPPGEYHAVAVEYLESGREADPEVLTRLREDAAGVRLAEAEKKALDLTLVVPR